MVKRTNTPALSASFGYQKHRFDLPFRRLPSPAACADAARAAPPQAWNLGEGSRFAWRPQSLVRWGSRLLNFCWRVEIFWWLTSIADVCVRVHRALHLWPPCLPTSRHPPHFCDDGRTECTKQLFHLSLEYPRRESGSSPALVLIDGWHLPPNTSRRSNVPVQQQSCCVTWTQQEHVTCSQNTAKV